VASLFILLNVYGSEKSEKEPKKDLTDPAFNSPYSIISKKL
jgi:hypothetical protein